jgi:EpsI family protein
VKKKNLYFLIACMALSLASMFTKTLGNIAAVDLPQQLEQFPGTIGKYTQTDFNQMIGNFFDHLADDSLLRVYQRKGAQQPIYIYVGYWENQDEQKGIRSPRYTTEKWGYYWIKTKTLIISGNDEIQMKEFVNERGAEKELVYYSYIIDGKIVPDEYHFRLLKAVNSLLYRRNNAALLRVSTPITNDFTVEMAEPYIEGFLREFLPVVMEYLPR